MFTMFTVRAMSQTLGSALATSSVLVLRPLPGCHHLPTLKGSHITSHLCSEAPLPTTHIHTTPSAPCPALPSLTPASLLLREQRSPVPSQGLTLASPSFSDTPMALSLPSFRFLLQYPLLSVGAPPAPSPPAPPKGPGTATVSLFLSGRKGIPVCAFTSFTRNSHHPKPTLTTDSLIMQTWVLLWQTVSFAIFSLLFPSASLPTASFLGTKRVAILGYHGHLLADGPDLQRLRNKRPEMGRKTGSGGRPREDVLREWAQGGLHCRKCTSSSGPRLGLYLTPSKKGKEGVEGAQARWRDGEGREKESLHLKKYNRGAPDLMVVSSSPTSGTEIT